MKKVKRKFKGRQETEQEIAKLSLKVKNRRKNATTVHLYRCPGPSPGA